MIIERLGETSPSLHEMLEALGAELDGDKIVIPNLGIRKTEDGLEVNVLHRYCLFDESKWLSLKRVNMETVS